MTPNNSSLTIEEIKTRHRRLAILRSLRNASGYSANLIVLRDWLPTLGLAAATDQLRDDLRRLGGAGFIELDETHEAWPISLTEHGLEVAEGRLTADGVEKPSPDCPY